MIVMGIEDILLHDETIFQDINAFNPDYMPENYNFRDSQMEAMAMSIRPALNNGRPINTVILGSCATGKTTAIKKLFEMVEKTSNKVFCCYINCQLHTTRFSIFSQIHKKIFGHAPPETGIPVSRVYEKIMQHLSDEKKALLVAFDDVDYLFKNNMVNKIFYDILRAYEEFPGVRTGLFAILSELEFRFVLDKNVNTVFIPQEVSFSPYTRTEILNILTDRAKAGFYPGVINNDILEEITDYSIDGGDLRTGIDLLRICGNIAESNASRTIELSHLEEAKSKSNSLKLVETLRSLSKSEKSLLKVIAAADDSMNSGPLSKLFIEDTGLSYATFGRALEKLEFLRLIDTKFTGKGIRGNSRQIILRVNKEDVKKCLL
ncbi:MAG: ORC1-type DNA replication protein [Methanobrevibacter sp.]|nr:ORC1-type DNA replication protein [Methanobrevibacter sp.]MEA4957028.1 ORC1-type DNA replication protein [Methanobrevibacter sp.]